MMQLHIDLIANYLLNSEQEQSTKNIMNKNIRQIYFYCYDYNCIDKNCLYNIPYKQISKSYFEQLHKHRKHRKRLFK